MNNFSVAQTPAERKPLNLTTEIVTPTGQRVKPVVTVFRGDNGVNFYKLFVDNTEIGWMKLSVEKTCVYIGKMHNRTNEAPFSERYANVGRALHEVAFRESFNYGKNGNVEFSAVIGTVLFHMSCGYIPCHTHTKKADPVKASEIHSAVTQAKVARSKGLANPFYNIPLGSGHMFLSPENIKKLEAVYFNSPPQKMWAQTLPHVVLSPVVSHPVYQKVEMLVSAGKLSRRDANDLVKKLLSPSLHGDKETWELALSDPCLNAMNAGYFNGFVIGTYFAQHKSAKLKHLLNRWGLYAFSRFLVGWHDCIASDATTLEFIFSDYGVKALDEGYIKPKDFIGKLPAHKHFSEELYFALKSGTLKAKALFCITHPAPKPMHVSRLD